MGLKEASFYRKLKNDKVQCKLCPHFCVIENGVRGNCNVRQNINGKLFSLVYESPCTVSTDPIEKKPLYHFLPGEKTLSIATPGCNLKCKNCQNADISQALPENVPSQKIKVNEVVKKTIDGEMKIISYTYTEPTIFYEYMLDISKAAKAKNLKNVMITNGFINQPPLKKICKYLDGANIDLKSMDNDFYEKICDGKLEPILETIKTMKKQKVWIELTNLIIPGLNDSLYSVRKLVSFVLNELGTNVPVHFTSFFPTYQLIEYPTTPRDILIKARKIATNAGMNYVYTGNIPDDEGSNTYCPNCSKPVIIRTGFHVVENKLKEGKCKCGVTIPGVWK